MVRFIPSLSVFEDQEMQIHQWLAALGTLQQVALCCRIVLAAGRGESEASIAVRLNVNRKTVRLWRERFARWLAKLVGDRAGTRAQSHLWSGPCQSDPGGHLALEAERCDALELPAHGDESGNQQIDREQSLEKP